MDNNLVYQLYFRQVMTDDTILIDYRSREAKTRCLQMNSTKELLHHSIDRLSEAEARQTLEFVQSLQQSSNLPPTLRRLALDPAFKITPGGLSAFPVVKPIQAKGIAASKLLVEERR